MLNRKTIEKQHYVEGVALVVDINGSEKLIGVGEDGLTAQFFRDLLCGGIHAVEEHGGSVIAYTGDGFQAILPDEEAAAHASWEIARDLRKTRDILSRREGMSPQLGHNWTSASASRSRSNGACSRLVQSVPISSATSHFW